jgi:hypothetical protein
MPHHILLLLRIICAFIGRMDKNSTRNLTTYYSKPNHPDLHTHGGGGGGLPRRNKGDCRALHIYFGSFAYSLEDHISNKRYIVYKYYTNSSVDGHTYSEIDSKFASQTIAPLLAPQGGKSCVTASIHPSVWCGQRISDETRVTSIIMES